MIKISDICIIQKKSKIKAGEGKKEGKYKFFTSSNLQTKYLDTFQYNQPALIFGTGGNASIHYCEEPFSTSTDCIVLYQKNNSINLKVIYRFFEGNMQILENGFKGIGLKHISKDYILNISLNYMEDKVQNELIDVFEKIDYLVILRKKQLEKLDKLVKSCFVEMFGDLIHEKKYQSIPLRKLCKTISGGTPSTKIPEYYNGNIPWISTVSLGNNHIDGSNAKGYITKNAIEHSATHLIPAGNILFGIRVGVGKSSLNDVDICTNQDVVAIIGIDETKYSKLFIKHVLDAYQPHFCNIKKGATILGITTDDLKNSLIPQVPIKLQKNYEKFVYQVDKQKLTIQQSLDKLEILKKALMQQYFG